MDNSINILEKIFTTYNEVTKYFDVKVIMNKDKSYSFKLMPIKGKGGKGQSKLDFLIEQFMLFRVEQDKRWAEQQKFNEFVLQQFKKHGWVK